MSIRGERADSSVSDRSGSSRVAASPLRGPEWEPGQEREQKASDVAGVPPTSDSRVGIVLAVGLQLGAALAALGLGLGNVVAVVFPVAAVGIAVLLVHDHRSAAYLEFVLWLWLLSPELRRIVDLGVGWTPVSPVMLAAPAATLVCIIAALFGRRPVHGAVSRALFVSLIAVAYGFLVGMVKIGLSASLGALLSWLPPLAIGLYVATSGPETEVVRRALQRTAVWGAIALGGYGALQFFMLPDWDRYWMENAPLFTIGAPRPLEVRVFSTLNSPAPFATVLGVLLVLLTGSRSRVKWLAAVAGFTSFGLSLVRMAWLGLIVSIAALMTGGHARVVRSVLLAIVVPILLLVSIGGPARDVVTDRFSSSVESGGDDHSLTERVAFHQRLLPVLARDVVGDGLGAVGVATKLSNDRGELSRDANFDGGGLETLFTFGIGVGTALLVATVAAVVAVWLQVSRSTDALQRAMAAALIGMLVQLLFGNPLVSVSGVFFWVLLGLLGRRDSPA